MVEAMVFATLQAYTAARKEKHQLKKIGEQYFPKTLMAISPKLKLGTGPDAQSTCEWGQIEIDRIAEGAINKI